MHFCKRKKLRNFCPEFLGAEVGVIADYYT